MKFHHIIHNQMMKFRIYQYYVTVYISYYIQQLVIILLYCQIIYCELIVHVLVVYIYHIYIVFIYYLYLCYLCIYYIKFSQLHTMIIYYICMLKQMRISYYIISYIYPLYLIVHIIIIIPSILINCIIWQH